MHNCILWGLKFFFPCSPNSAQLYQKDSDSTSQPLQLTYIMCLERRFFNRGSEALSHAVQDTDQ